MIFNVTSEKPGPLGIRDLLQRHADSLWVPDHLDDSEATDFVLEHFRRQLDAEMQMIQISVRYPQR